MRKISILLVASLIFLAACSSFFKVEVLLDNPTNAELKVYVDDETYDLAAKEYVALRLVKGEHYLKAEKNDTLVFDGTISVTQTGVINLCRETYVLHRDLYLQDQGKYENFASEELDLKDVEIVDKIYQNVDFLVFEDEVFIPKCWDYCFNEDLPNEVKSGSEDFEIVEKLYRLEDLERAWGFNGHFDFSESSDEELQLFLDSLAQHFKEDETILEN